MAISVLFASACGSDRENDGILVLAAASLTDALVEVGEQYEAETGRAVTFSFGGSTALARQVEFGAPADALLFAGTGPMDQLTESDRIKPGSRFNLLTNRLVVIGEGGTAPIGSLDELSETSGRIALADPALAPAGRYAKQALESAGLWEGLESRIIPTLDVRASVGAVDSGGAEYGVVYATDAAGSAGVSVVFDVPERLHDPIVYPAAVVSGAEVKGATDFLEFLKTESSLAVFARFGFDAAVE